MTGTSILRERFWDEKILAWENQKYSNRAGPFGIDFNRSVKMRLNLAKRMLVSSAKDMTVLELGCGSAQLMPYFVRGGAKEYTGVDLSERAISMARLRADKLGSLDRVRLICGDVTQLDFSRIDICFSLGLLDWLLPDDICRLARSIDCQFYLHSFSERQQSVSQFLHKMYVFLAYGYRNRGYVPCYYTKEQISCFLSLSGKAPSFYGSSDLSFGQFAFYMPRETQCLYG